MVMYCKLLLALLRRRHKVTSHGFFLTYDISPNKKTCLISNRHQGIKLVMSPQPPNAYHVYCIRHIASNFNHKFKNAKLKEELIKLSTSSLYLYLISGKHIFFSSTFSVAYTTCLHQFKWRLEKFEEINEEIVHWIGAFWKKNGAWYMTKVVVGITIWQPIYKRQSIRSSKVHEICC